jgi:hypothetical protein
VKQLTGIDAAMLYMETPTAFFHMSGLMIFETPSPGFDPCAAVYAKFASLVGELELLRRRLVDVPLGLDHPYWEPTPTLTLTSTSAKSIWLDPGWSTRSAIRSAGSSVGPRTARGRCGSSTSSSARNAQRWMLNSSGEKM